MSEEDDDPKKARVWPWVAGFAAAAALFVKRLGKKETQETAERLAEINAEVLKTPEERVYEEEGPRVWSTPPAHRTPAAEPPVEAWSDRRFPLSLLWYRLAYDPVPERASWLYTFGAALAALVIIQITTGIFLLVYYVPSWDGAYQSVQYIQHVAPLGWLIRNIHWWTMVMLVLLIGVHMARTFFSAAYKRPRELIWILGVFLLLVMVGLAFTGQSLRGDQAAYWQNVVAARITGYVPIIGRYLQEVMLGGQIVGQPTITRFFLVHIWILPSALVLIMGIHIWLIIVQGQFGSWLNYEKGHKDAKPAQPENVASMRKLRQELADRNSHKHALPERTTWFIPYHFFKETVVALAAFLIVFLLAFLVQAPIEAKADPAVFAYLPEPMWFLYFQDQFFLLLPQWMIPVATTFVPLIVLVLLLLLPFLDQGRDIEPFKRPGAMAIGVFAVLAVLTLSVLAVGRIFNYRLIIPGG